ncbi:hypothetical protein M3A96_08610 [Helcobacillus massiliensis]|uniref:Cytosine/adenosine deaminase-related metal-dependent hydrolase n=1 Tax=Helcobacillus massiliensis TaxID=521392 RepID=A0A839QQR7_9MICO|nr:MULTISPECIES: hypothetical protein [Helcobacillus]MBB3022823.1 cytosine/adenosine deaminase-related metal-dependent hydrolase [Helcobacillus massiliensis]MCG7428109.1 hypothetical protein [Helcobacillus sp. ACRRO]MCT1558174.1 hypothetical protein [Helcobacillus massiliensis]MCT2036471.1 hypothetical protein [Helcobacillus massiliensis]MCT2332275.1 hypothetical protein [Helcobacillus massiliensis]
MGGQTHDLEVGSRADIVLMEATGPLDALMRAPRRELAIAGGAVVVDAGEVLVG